MAKTMAQTANPGMGLTPDQVAEVVAQACPTGTYAQKRVLLIVPDATRTAPVGLLFQTLHAQIGEVTTAFDILIALGTHQPMSEGAICRRLEISEQQRRDKYGAVKFFNHAWDNPAQLKQIGALTSGETSQLTEGRLAMDVPVEINRMLFDYDQVI